MDKKKLDQRLREDAANIEAHTYPALTQLLENAIHNAPAKQTGVSPPGRPTTTLVLKTAGVFSVLALAVLFLINTSNPGLDKHDETLLAESSEPVASDWNIPDMTDINAGLVLQDAALAEELDRLQSDWDRVRLELAEHVSSVL